MIGYSRLMMTEDFDQENAIEKKSTYKKSISHSLRNGESDPTESQIRFSEERAEAKDATN